MAALAAMLFVQAAFALAACGLDPQALAHGRSMLVQQLAQPSCHEQDAGANLCLVHCQSGEQTLDKPLVKLPPLAASAPLPAVRSLHEPLEASAAVARLPLPFAGPPRHILFQSLLI